MHLSISGFNLQQTQWIEKNAAIYGYTFAKVDGLDLKYNPSITMSNLFFDALSFNQFIILRKNFQYLLPPDTNLQLLEELVKKIAANEKPAPGFMPPEMVARYRDSIFEKIFQLSELSKKPDLKSLKTFKDEVHKIAGSAGSFGFPEMTLISRKMESQLHTLIEGNETQSIDELRAILSQYQESLKLTFQNLLPI